MNPLQPPSSPTHFSWQSWLTITPIVALIGFGTWFILQEQRLSRQEAMDSLYKEGSDRIAQLESSVPIFKLIRQPSHFAAIHPLDVPRDVLVISVDPIGNCLIPPSPELPSLPAPRILPWNRLNESLSLLWEEAHQSTNPTQQLDLAHSFLAAQPPSPFSVLMGLTKVNALIKEDRLVDAFNSIQKSRQNLPLGIHSEAGFPLTVLLDLQELRVINKHLIAGEDATEALIRFGTQQLQHPTEWTRQILNERLITENASTNIIQLRDRIIKELDRQTEARALHASIPRGEWLRWIASEKATAHWIQHGSSWFLVHRITRQETSQEYVVITEKSLSTACREALAPRLNETQFRYSVLIDGRTLTLPDYSSIAPPTKDATESIHAVQTSLSHPWLQLRTTLASPNTFFAQSRQRTRSLLLLIFLASIAGLVGWLAQRTAFRRQVALGHMKSNFVASVSHELRAPIASIRLMSENLQSSKKAHQQRRKNYLKWIRLECGRLSTLVDNVLQFSRLETGRSNDTFEPVDCRKLYEETIRLMEPIAINAEVHLKSSLNPPPSKASDPWPDGIWNGQAVHQALVNLVDNAIKHTPSDGTVTTQLELRADHQIARFIVIDQGPGIPPADRERIFSPFERLGSEETRSTKGVGIGLSLVRHTASVHGGNVSVQDGEKGGSCFILSLPLKSKQL